MGLTGLTRALYDKRQGQKNKENGYCTTQVVNGTLI
jgi:hypothetical protein